MRRHPGRDRSGSLRVFRFKIIDRFGDVFPPLHARHGAHLVGAGVHRGKPLEVVQERPPPGIVQVHDDRLQPFVECDGQLTHGLFFVPFVFGKPIGRIHCLAHRHPHATTEPRFLLVIDPQRHHPNRLALGECHRLLRDTRCAGLNLLDMRQVMAFALGENSHREPRCQVLRRHAKRLDVAPHRRLVVRRTVRGNHPHRAQQRPQHPTLEQGRLGHEPHRALGRNADQHRVNQRVGMVRDVKGGSLGWQPLSVRHANGRVIKTDHTPNRLAKQSPKKCRLIRCHLIERRTYIPDQGMETENFFRILLCRTSPNSTGPSPTAS